MAPSEFLRRRCWLGRLAIRGTTYCSGAPMGEYLGHAHKDCQDQARLCAREEAVRHITPATALVGGLWLALIPQTYGQSPPEGHLMVAPADLKWTSMPSL